MVCEGAGPWLTGPRQMECRPCRILSTSPRSTLETAGRHAGSFLSLEHFPISQHQNTVTCQRSESLLCLFLLGKGKVKGEGDRELGGVTEALALLPSLPATWQGVR